jgi:hypothetical protein
MNATRNIEDGFRAKHTHEPNLKVLTSSNNSSVGLYEYLIFKKEQFLYFSFLPNLFSHHHVIQLLIQKKKIYHLQQKYRLLI